MGEAAHLLVDLVDLLEDGRGLGGGDEEAGLALEEADAEAFLGVLDEPADPRGGDVEEVGRAGDRAGHHDGPDHLDLAEREVAHGARLGARRVGGERKPAGGAGA